MSSQSPSCQSKHMIIREPQVQTVQSVFQTPMRNGVNLQDNRSLLADILSSNSLTRGRDSGQKSREINRTPTLPSSISEILQNLTMSPSTNFLYQSPASLEKYMDSFSRERINVLKLMKLRHCYTENTDLSKDKTEKTTEKGVETNEIVEKSEIKDKPTMRSRGKENSGPNSKIHSNQNSASKSVTSESEISLNTARNLDKIVESLFTDRILAKKNLMNMFDNESVILGKVGVAESSSSSLTCNKNSSGEKEILTPKFMKRKTLRPEKSEISEKESDTLQEISPSKGKLNIQNSHNIQNFNILQDINSTQKDYQFLSRLPQSNNKNNNLSSFKEFVMNSPSDRKVRKVSFSSYNYFSDTKSATSFKKKIIFCSEKKNPSNMNTSAKSCSSEFSTDKKERKRLRKSSEQLKCLKELYDENANKDWTKEMITEISIRVGLPQNKVYKWFWDKKNKEMGEKKVFFISSGKKEQIFSLSSNLS
jgi:hypothetical protein